ncbi:MAG: hypothetical protein GX382_08230 [Syntrophomonadaceae bacterium]|jgi:transposase-like protein|nr:hypothetical protein [Syntrophomonadaceae bacterium]
MELEPKQQQAIIALLTQPTITGAAESIGINPKTLHEWLKQPDFREAYAEARDQTMDQAITRLQQAISKAIDTLIAIMGSDLAKDAARVTAARTILDMAFKAYELEQIAERLTKLEQRLEGLNEQAQRGNQ